MIEQMYEALFIVIMTMLSLVALGYLVRAMIGPKFSDRILAVNGVQTQIIMIICILSVFQKENYIVDISLIYAMLGFVTVVIVCKAYLRSHHKDRAKDLVNLKEEVKR